MIRVSYLLDDWTFLGVGLLIPIPLSNKEQLEVKKYYLLKVLVLHAMLLFSAWGTYENFLIAFNRYGLVDRTRWIAKTPAFLLSTWSS